MRLRILLIALLISSPAYAGKRCDFVDDDGACNDADSVLSIQRIKKGTPYGEMKRRLAAEGIYSYPRASSDPSRCKYFPEVCREYPETIACYSASGADCSFRVQMKYGVVVVKTLYARGEQRVSGVHILNTRDEKELADALREGN